MYVGTRETVTIYLKARPAATCTDFCCESRQNHRKIAMPEEARDQSLFMGHPEVTELLNELFPLLVQESDRGAVLLGVSYIDAQLSGLFNAICPDGLSNNRRKEMLGYPGTLSTLSGKLDVAYVCRLLPVGVIEPIRTLKKIRNDVAHKVEAFKLAEWEDALQTMMRAIGENVDLMIKYTTIQAAYTSLIQKLCSTEHPLDEGRMLFDDPESAAKHISESDEIKEIVESNRPRAELAIAVGIVCGLIVFHRDKAVDLFGDAKTASAVVDEMKRKGE